MNSTNHPLLSRCAALAGAFALLLATGWADSRVYVQFAPNAKGNALNAVAQAGGRVHYEFDHLNAAAVTVPDQALAGLSRNPNIVLIEEDPIRVMSGQTTPYGVTMVWEGYPISTTVTGTGIVVGVIDSGVYSKHEDFAGLPLNGEPGGDPGTVEIAWNRDKDSHGTHVVGTIAAANNLIGVVGVAPGVGGIYMVKVFGDSGNWIYSSTLLKAVQQAVKNGGARIISMSLGGSAASRTEKAGLQAVYDGGVLLVAAAGNAGNTSVSYPAGYESVISVAAVDANKALASFSQRNSDVELAAPGVGVLSTVSYCNAKLFVSSVSYLAGALEYTAQKTVTAPLADGGLATGTSADWAGKVVLVQRGTNSFAEKVTNVANSGGLAAIIYNNTSGGFSGTLGSASAIPAISISQEDGRALINTAIGTNATVSTEPGTKPGFESGYDYFDGTSMATPHVSGVAALVWSAFPNATNAQVRQALDESATDLGVAGRDSSFGYGLVNAGKALTRLGAIVGSDTTAPVISNVTSTKTNPKTGTFQISWTTNEPATGSVTVDGLGSASSTALTTTHQFSFKGTKGATYNYTVRSTDKAGNPATPVTGVHYN